METSLKRAATALLAMLALAVPGAAAEPTSKEKALFEKLRARVEAVDRSLDGVLGVAIRDHKTGATIDIRADEVFPTASTIKVAILYELFRQAEERRVDLVDRKSVV